MSEQPPIRIGTAEREAAYSALNTHLDAGRLDVEEYGDRYAKASLARTRAELDQLFLDLPAPHGVIAPIRPSRPLSERVGALVPRFIGVAPFLAFALFFATGAWACLFIIPASMMLFGGHRRGQWNHHSDNQWGRRGRGCR